MKNTQIIAALLLVALLPSSSSARCFKDCQRKKGSTTTVQVQSREMKSYNEDSYNRNESHNIDEGLRNSVAGNMEVQIGHKGVSVSGVGKNSVIDNSINSTIVLGNVNQ